MFLRNIKDIQISKNRITVIRDVTVTLEEIEQQISEIVYVPAKDVKCEITENALFPPFIQSFYYLFFSRLKVPGEEDCWLTYISWIGGKPENKTIFIDGKEFETEGVRARFNRTYPSLLRDLHFLYLLDSTNKFEVVEYSMERDYYNGLDLKVRLNGIEVFVSLFIDTSRGRYYKSRKTTRHDYSELREIEFNVDFDSLTKSGTVYLLNLNHVSLLEKLIHGN